MLELISLVTRALNKYETYSKTRSLMRFKSLNLPLARMHAFPGPEAGRPAGTSKLVALVRYDD